MNKNNLSIIRQQFAQSVFNHKIQEKAVERISKINNTIKIGNITLLFLIILFLVLQLKYPENFIFAGVSIGITIFEILFFAFQKEFSFEEKENNHKQSAKSFLKLRDRFLILIADTMSGVNDEKIKLRRNGLFEQYEIISSLAPQTNSDDYNNAQEKILGKKQRDEEYTWSDEEIDRFLPKELMSTNNYLSKN